MKRRSQPAPKAVVPYTRNAGAEGRPEAVTMNRGVGVFIITHADIRVNPNATSGCKGVVDVDEAAFRRFDVIAREGVGDATESQGLVTVERRGVEGY